MQVDSEMNVPLDGSKGDAIKNVKWANARLEELLGYGKYQKFQVWVFLGLVSFIGAMDFFHVMFLVTKKLHRCALPGNLEEKYAHSNVSSFVKDCHTFRYVESTCDASDLTTCFDFTQEEACTSFVHDMSSDDAFWSMASEYDWICDKAELGSTVLVGQNIGIIISMVIFMQLSDTWGRSPVFHLTNFIFIIFRLIAMHVADNYWAFIVLLSLGSTFPPLGMRIGYTLAAEWTNERGRLWVYAVGWVTWVAGVGFLPLIAWLTQNWYYYGIIVPLLNVVFIPFIWLTPESPRLLLTKGKVDQALKAVYLARQINGQKEESREALREELQAISNQICEEKVYGVVTLLKSRRLAFYTFFMSLVWVCNDFLYIGGQLNVENLAGNQFVNFTLMGLTELPSVFIGEFLISRFGRRWVQAGCFTVTATVYSVMVLLLVNGQEADVIITSLAIAARTVGNVGWFIMWVQCVELFPTTVRVTGSNLASLVANIVCTGAPYIILLGDTNLPLMYGVFLVVALFGAFSATLLPETLKQPFPETVEDVEERQTHPYLSWRVWQ